MGFLHIITFLSMLALIVSHAAAAAHVRSSSSPEAYWKSVLPNTPIPNSVSELLKIDTPPGTRAEETHTSVGVDEHVIIDTPPGTRVDTTARGSSVGEHSDKHSPASYGTTGALLFLEKDMYNHQSHLKKNLKFTKPLIIPSSTFLPRKVADTIPFSSNNLPELYKRFSIKPGSKESESMKKSISLCEDEAMKGEEKYCATSLEDMVDFTTSKLGKKVKAISTEVIHPNKLQKYTMDSSRKLAKNEFVNCHRLSYPYPVFYCHKVISTRAYSISLSGQDGTKAKALAICHDNGAKLYSKDLVLKVLGVTPGSAQICHFLPQDHVVFVPY